MMAEPAFSPEIEKALDAYVVPLMQPGFSDRLMARIASSDTGTRADSVALPKSRAGRASPWRRTGRIVGVVATFSLATATAAAAGIFGSPVYVPGVSEALVEAKIVDAPVPAFKPKVRVVAEAEAVEPAIEAQPPTTGSAAIVNKVNELRKDPEFAKLPARERLKVAGREVRQMVRSGEASREDVRTAVREIVRDADPVTKEEWRKQAAERREQRLEWRAARRDATPEERAAFRQALRERRAARQEPSESDSEQKP